VLYLLRCFAARQLIILANGKANGRMETATAKRERNSGNRALVVHRCTRYRTILALAACMWTREQHSLL